MERPNAWKKYTDDQLAELENSLKMQALRWREELVGNLDFG